MKTPKGFSLIELMTVVAVIGILAAIAYPNYVEYLVRAKIPDATVNLAAKRVQMEQFFQDNRQYADLTTTSPNILATACVADTTTSKNFDFSCPTQTATAYTLQATGKGSMTGFSYTLDQSNAKSSTVTGVSGWTGNATCWVTSKGGAC